VVSSLQFSEENYVHFTSPPYVILLPLIALICKTRAFLPRYILTEMSRCLLIKNAMHSVTTAKHSPTHHTAHQARKCLLHVWLNEIRYRYTTGQFKQIILSQIAKYADKVQTSQGVAPEHAGMFTSL
jgi:hypothetical protein